VQRGIGPADTRELFWLRRANTEKMLPGSKSVHTFSLSEGAGVHAFCLLSQTHPALLPQSTKARPAAGYFVLVFCFDSSAMVALSS